MIFPFENSNLYNSSLFIFVVFVDSGFFFFSVSQKHQLCTYWLCFYCLSNLFSLQKFILIAHISFVRYFHIYIYVWLCFQILFVLLLACILLLHFFISIFIFFLNSSSSSFISFYLSYAVFPKLFCLSLNSFLESISLTICTFHDCFVFLSLCGREYGIFYASIYPLVSFCSLPIFNDAGKKKKKGSAIGRGRESEMKWLESSWGSW